MLFRSRIKLPAALSESLGRIMVATQHLTGKPPIIIAIAHDPAFAAAVDLCSVGAQFGTLGPNVRAVLHDLISGQSGHAPDWSALAPLAGTAANVATAHGLRVALDNDGAKFVTPEAPDVTVATLPLAAFHDAFAWDGPEAPTHNELVTLWHVGLEIGRAHV